MALIAMTAPAKIPSHRLNCDRARTPNAHTMSTMATMRYTQP